MSQILDLIQSQEKMLSGSENVVSELQEREEEEEDSPRNEDSKEEEKHTEPKLKQKHPALPELRHIKKKKKYEENCGEDIKGSQDTRQEGELAKKKKDQGRGSSDTLNMKEQDQISGSFGCTNQFNAARNCVDCATNKDIKFEKEIEKTGKEQQQREREDKIEEAGKKVVAKKKRSERTQNKNGLISSGKKMTNKGTSSSQGHKSDSGGVMRDQNETKQLPSLWSNRQPTQEHEEEKKSEETQLLARSRNNLPTLPPILRTERTIINMGSIAPPTIQAPAPTLSYYISPALPPYYYAQSNNGLSMPYSQYSAQPMIR